MMKKDSYLDYYEALQISPNADQETIERCYRLLAKKYHPDNPVTGNNEKFRAISSANEVLSDPERRASYDVKYDELRKEKLKIFSKISPSQGVENDKKVRHAILSTLYVDRRRNPTDAGVGSFQLEQLLGWPEKMLEFHIWFLKEKGWIQRVDTGGYAITASGVEVVEENGLILGEDRLLKDQNGLSINSDGSEKSAGAKTDCPNNAQPVQENLA
jgi:hypothetical protein